jgi:YVTN family beta-propeller protein
MRLARGAAATLLLATAACSDGSGSGTPRLDGVSDASGDGVAVIGEVVALTGEHLDDAGVVVSIGGVEARVLERGPGRLTARVPPGAPVGEVAVVVGDDRGESPPVALHVRRLAFATNFSDQSLSVLEVDGVSAGLLGRVEIPVPPGPFAIDVTPDGAVAVVACSSAFLPDAIVATLAPGAPPGDTVVLLDTATFTIVGMVVTGEASRPTGIAISPDGSTAYVTNYATSTITVLDIARAAAIGEIAVPRQPEELAISADGALLLVASDGGTASVVDVREARVLATVETGGNDPSGVAFSPDARLGYVTNSFTDATLGEDGTLTVLDLGDPERPRVVDTIADGIGPTPYDVRLSPDGRLAVVTNLNVIFEPLEIGPGSLSLVDLSASPPSVAVIPVGTAPIHAKFAPGGGLVLAGNGLSQSVSLVDVAARAVVSTLGLGTTIGPADVVVQP